MQLFLRLKEERDRLKLTQADFAAAGGVSKRAQIYYEQGERSPSAEYLAGIAKAGVDVGYILTGIRQASSYQSAPLKVSETCAESTDREYREGISSEEQALLDNFRTLSEEDRRAIRRQSDVFAELNRIIKQQKDKKVG